jgi:hypothetical protein
MIVSYMSTHTHIVFFILKEIQFMFYITHRNLPPPPPTHTHTHIYIQVVTHHVPFVIGMLPSVSLVFFCYDDFRTALYATPFSMPYMAAGCLTSFNEALWVASSFFTQSMLESKAYRVGQKLSALLALTQVPCVCVLVFRKQGGGGG